MWSVDLRIMYACMTNPEFTFLSQMKEDSVLYLVKIRDSFKKNESLKKEQVERLRSIAYECGYKKA